MCFLMTLYWFTIVKNGKLLQAVINILFTVLSNAAVVLNNIPIYSTNNFPAYFGFLLWPYDVNMSID